MNIIQAPKSLYDKKYYEEDIKTTTLNLSPLPHSIADVILNLQPLKESDYVVDFGCGSGSLSILLHHFFRCKVLGIDYSQDAIDFCKKLHSDVCDAKVSFLCSDIDDLPMLENVTHVYLADVVEHLYDNELNKLLLIISKWNLNENFPLLIIHTDNNLYIKFFRPIVDLFMLLFCKTSFLEICNRNAFEKPRHVNLMSPNQLNKKLLKAGFSRLIIKYPEITTDRFMSQFPQLVGNLFISKILIFIYPVIKFFAPSFYTVYQKR
jgi:SAM-dependent methyltransferase